MPVPIIGLVGGIAPESTIAYYRLLVAGHRERFPGTYPAVLINSIDLTRLLSLAGSSDLAGLADYLSDAVARLASGGATLGGFASNTPHLVFAQVAERSPIPLVSIVEATAERARALGLGRVGLLGTRFTMEAPFYPRVFAQRGITVLTPDAAGRDYVHRIYVEELVAARFRPETRAGVMAVVEQLRQGAGVEAVILGGTELPLLLDEVDSPLPLLDTTRIHVEALLARAWESGAATPEP
jgi:aspartate racemase